MPIFRLAAAPMAVVLAAAVAPEPLSFHDYLVAHGKSYSGDEYVRRKALYDSRIADHARLNARPGATWIAGPGPLTDVFPDEMPRFFGYAGRPGDAPSDSGGGLESFVGKAVDELPLEVDWRQHTPKIVPPVRDQGGCGACWAFSAVSTIEAAVAKATGKLVDLSTQQLTSCVPNPRKCGGPGGCGGSTTWLAFNYTVQHGIASQERAPYESGLTNLDGGCKPAADYPPVVGITGYAHLPTNNYAALMRAVATHGPVSVSLDAWEWYLYAGGIFDQCNKTEPIINHAVTMVGYGEERGVKYWTIQNSWGRSFGEDGYIRLRRYGEADEPCGMNPMPELGSLCEGGPTQQWVCGECGILSDTSYPTGAYLSTPGHGRRLYSGFLV